VALLSIVNASPLILLSKIGRMELLAAKGIAVVILITVR
jgi:hypothetical protein